MYTPLRGTQLQFIQKIIGGYSDEGAFSPASSDEDEVIRATHVNIWKSHCASRRAGQKDFLHYQHQRMLRVGEGAHIGESYHRKELLIAMSSQSYSRD